MALNVTITKGSTYTLKCDVVDHSFVRMVTQTGLPSEDEGQAPSEDGVFLLDLGICIETLTLTGIIDDSPNDSSVSISEITTGVRTWWAYGDTKENLLQISYPSGSGSESYYGSIRNATFRKSAGQPGRWEYSIAFYIKSTVSA